MRNVWRLLLRCSLATGCIGVGLALLAPAGCGGGFVGSDGGPDGGHPGDTSVPDVRGDRHAPHDASDSAPPADGPLPVPTYHRPNDSQCGTTAPKGNCMVGLGCMNDGQCTDGGPSGRCIQNNGGAAECVCSYDTCLHDTDCPTGQLCVCHGSGYSDGYGNTCMPGNCRVDSDCGADGYCSPSHGTSGCGEVTGYYCHTSRDTCTNDNECGSMGSFDVCAWSESDKRWECLNFTPCA
jgi:hypothetical protein